MLSGKRILIVFCSLELGGAERQGFHLARFLKNKGCDVRVWSSLAGPGLVIDTCEATNIPWEVHRFLWPCRKSSFVRDLVKLLWALWKERPDVILTYTTMPNVGYGLIWKFSPAQVCIWGQRNVHGLMGNSRERFAYRQTSAVICNARHQIDYLKQTLGETRAPLFVVHNGVQLDPCLKSRKEWRSDLNIGKDILVATMVANFRAVKDHRTVLRAWDKILTGFADDNSHPQLLLAGAPQDSFEDIRQYIHDLKIDKSVHLLGQVKDVSGLLAASDIGILISHHEGLSNAIVEYMASGLPVVATDLPGNREVLGDGYELPLCKPGSVDNLTENLCSLIDNPDFRHRLGERNRKRATTKFSVNTMCETTAGIIVDLLSRKKTGEE